jgi:hypothetical protein
MPRSGRTGVEASTDGIVVPTAREVDARRKRLGRPMASAHGIPASGVTLRRGRRSREKVFELADMTEVQALQRLRG